MDMIMLAEGLQVIDDLGIGLLGVAIGCGLVVLGAAFGIGKLASSSVESIARQPEAGGRIFTTMIIAAALIEGFTFFALVVCMMGMGNLKRLAEVSMGQG